MSKTMPKGSGAKKAPVGSSHKTGVGEKPRGSSAHHEMGKTVPSFQEKRNVGLSGKAPKSKTR